MHSSGTLTIKWQLFALVWAVFSQAAVSKDAEDPIHAIEREVLEECGLVVSVVRLVGRAVEIVYSVAEQTCFEKAVHLPRLACMLRRPRWNAITNFFGWRRPKLFPSSLTKVIAGRLNDSTRPHNRVLSHAAGIGIQSEADTLNGPFDGVAARLRVIGTLARSRIRMAVKIRRAKRSDAAAIGTLASEFQNYLRKLGDPAEFKFGADEYLRDGFGSRRAFEGLVAEAADAIVGYALFHDGYETDRGRRLIHLIDLYVQETRRRQGIGGALLQRVAALGQTRGAEFVLWSVYEPNEQAARFYEKVGARYLTGLHWMLLDIPK
jgi:ribosomal protein S18 acetylase RimI-like enzyme